jgi:predicted O-methyltransferase YrrM
VSDFSKPHVVDELLSRLYGAGGTAGAFTPDGMAVSELKVLYEMASAPEVTRALEVGMANGTSSVIIGTAIANRPGAKLVSVDPFQTAHYKNQGVANVARAGLSALHELRELPNYLALPDLVREEQRFDLILVDGWHSFDHALLDCFFADLLLREGGLLLMHDTDSPPVYKAARFFESHRPYARVSPPLVRAVPSLPGRIRGRLSTIARGPAAMRERQQRRTRWRTLGAYRKLRSELTPDSLLTDF